MVSYLEISIFAFLFCGAACRAHGRSYAKIAKSSHYIVGGHEIPIKKAPYQVHLLLFGEKLGFCGGSILSARYILTAAHCLEKVKRIDVRVGSADSESGGAVHSTDTFKIHPKYDSDTLDFDVAYIMLKNDINLDGKKTKAVTLPKDNAEVPANTTLLVSGWGDITEDGLSSRQLRAVMVNTFTKAHCKKAYRELTNRMICAGTKNGGKDACAGDSGGPAVNNGVQLGIVSFGEGCGRRKYPGVYTNVSAVRQWIKKNTGV